MIENPGRRIATLSTDLAVTIAMAAVRALEPETKPRSESGENGR